MHSGQASVKANDSRRWKPRDSEETHLETVILTWMVSHPDRFPSAEQEQEQNWAKDDWRGTGTARIIGVFWYTLQLELPDLDI